MAMHIRRREFIFTLGGAVAAWPLAARAQQPERVRRIGVLMNLSENDPEARGLVAAFREGLAQLGGLTVATCRSTTVGLQATHRCATSARMPAMGRAGRSGS
jgi:hypothetical protein